MRRFLFVCMGALLFVGGLGLVPVISQDMGGDGCMGDEGDAGEDGGDDMEAWKDAQKPGEAHELLAKMVGDWDMSFKMWMQPGAEPTVMEMTTTFEPRYGGRFIVGGYDMIEGPFPHKGETWFGHDNSKGKFQWMRITDMDTTMRVYEGEYDEEASAITLHASYNMDWMGQTFEVKERNVWTFINDDKFKMEVFTEYVGMPDMPEEGIKEVEITYTRAEAQEPATQDPNGVLEKLAGDFKVDMKLWFEPGADPMAMTAEMTYDWTLDGQAIVSEYDASDMEVIPHKGIEYISYDETSGEYESIRLTSMSGDMTVWSGKYDKESKTLEFTAPVTVQMEGQKLTGTSRAVYEWVNDDKYNCTVYTRYDGMEEEIKEVEMTFTRK